MKVKVVYHFIVPWFKYMVSIRDIKQLQLNVTFTNVLTNGGGVIKLYAEITDTKGSHLSNLLLF